MSFVTVIEKIGRCCKSIKHYMCMKRYLYGGFGVIIAVVLGVLGLTDKQSLPVLPDKKDIPVVTVMDVKLENRKLKKRFIGKISSTKEVRLMPMVSGIVDKVYVSESSVVSKDGVLVALDKESKKEALEMAEASLKEAEIEFKGIKLLKEDGYRSESKFYGALSKLKDAQRAVIAARDSLSRSSIVAPFDGTINSLDVKEGDVVSAYSSVIGIMHDHNNMVADFFIPEVDVYSVRSGSLMKQEVSVVDPRGIVLKGSISSVAIKSDSITKSYNVIVDLVVPEDVKVYMGATLEIYMTVSESMAYHIENSTLGINDEMQLGIKVLDENNVVSFIPVKVVDEDDHSKGFWVTPVEQNHMRDSLKVVHRGQAYVTDGVKVEISH